MLKALLFLSFGIIALKSTSNAQTIQNTVWKSYINAVNDTVTLAIEKSSMTITSSHGMTLVKSTIRISNDTITIADVGGMVSCSQYDNGVYSYKSSGDKLILHIIADPCDERANSVSDREWLNANKK